MLNQLKWVIQEYPEDLRKDMLETLKTSEVNLHKYLHIMFGKGYTAHFRKEKLVRSEQEINTICDIAVNAGLLSHGALFCGVPGCGKTMTMLQVAHLIYPTLRVLRHYYYFVQSEP